METEELQVETVQGAIYVSLERNNKEIKKDRGDAIAEDLEMAFKRGVEDTATRLKRLNRERSSMFDFSPTNTQSLIMVKDLDALQIRDNDMKLSVEIRKLEIELEIAAARYEYLFGKKIS